MKAILINLMTCNLNLEEKYLQIPKGIVISNDLSFKISFGKNKVDNRHLIFIKIGEYS